MCWGPPYPAGPSQVPPMGPRFCRYDVPSSIYFINMCIISCFSHILLFVTPWTVAHQASLWVPQARILEWVAIPSSRGSSCPRDRTYFSYVSCISELGSLPLVPPGKPNKHVVNTNHGPCWVLFNVFIYIHMEKKMATHSSILA